MYRAMSHSFIYLHEPNNPNNNRKHNYYSGIWQDHNRRKHLEMENRKEGTANCASLQGQIDKTQLGSKEKSSRSVM